MNQVSSALRKVWGMDQSLADQAAETLSLALAQTNRHERARLMEEALRLHRRAVEARDALEAEANRMTPVQDSPPT
jgi:hypothetical protein